MAQEPDQQVNVRKRVPPEENPPPDDMWERPEERSGRVAGAAPPDGASTVQSERIVGTDEVEATRAEIEQTRAEMTETIDALQEKLDPQKIKDQAKTRATSSVRETGSRAAERVRQNPAVPLAVGGGIVGLLLLRLLSRSGGGRRAETVVFDLKKGTARRG